MRNSIQRKRTQKKLNAMDIMSMAVKCERSGHIMEAQQLYEEGIEGLKQMIDDEDEDPAQQKIYKKYLRDYQLHQRDLRQQVQRHMLSSKLVDQIEIGKNSRGHSYKSLFAHYFNDAVKEVHIFEPYLTDRYHFKNLVNFLELLVKSCRNLKYVRLVTKVDTMQPKNQLKVLKQIRSDMADGNIALNFRFDSSLHDRKIVLGNGVVIKIGRGLHFFQQCDTMYSLGLCDYDFRKCLPTEIDVWKSKPFAEPITDDADLDSIMNEPYESGRFMNIKETNSVHR